ncbi:hypothetical protein CDL15_Pgr001518 [Punica granatum]|uniref:Uncharacterized protein n=1 Tax=Punica granatum TaxID=22663 RepID=A0A218X3P9_PUNGR|nr:hypothetical protein CDL15_Pgr001518 [Punica granatum]
MNELDSQVDETGVRKRSANSQPRVAKEGKLQGKEGDQKVSSAKTNVPFDKFSGRNSERRTSKLIRTDSPGCGYAEMVEQLDTLLEIVPGSDLYYFILELLKDKNEREYFGAMKIPAVKVGWLQRQQLKKVDSSFLSMMSNLDS